MKVNYDLKMEEILKEISESGKKKDCLFTLVVDLVVHLF